MSQTLDNDQYTCVVQYSGRVEGIRTRRRHVSRENDIFCHAASRRLPRVRCKKQLAVSRMALLFPPRGLRGGRV